MSRDGRGPCVEDPYRLIARPTHGLHARHGSLSTSAGGAILGWTWWVDLEATVPDWKSRKQSNVFKCNITIYYPSD